MSDRHEWACLFVDTLGFLFLVAVVLSLGGCGSEADTDPNPQPVAVHELCSVSFLPDGTVSCSCVAVPTDYQSPPTRSGTQSPPPPAPWMVKP